MVSKKKQKTVCLVMIVKNESKVIHRCFDSVREYIDYWVIHDTGSTDETPKMIEAYFKKHKIPGKLYHTPWKNFGYNRTQAVQSAQGRADYLILMDADFICQIKDPLFKTKPMEADAYMIKYEGPLDYRQNLFVKGSLSWKYVGVTHEYIHCPQAKRTESGDFLTFLHPGDGGCRSDKFERDIRLLHQGLVEEPKNIRYMFYLAQSYKDIQEWTNAIEWYQKRIDAGGWPEEVYYAMYQIGMCKMRRGDDFYNFMGDLVRAFMFRPIRLEAMFHLVHYCYQNKQSLIGYQLGKMAINTEYPKDLLFVEKPVHDYLFLDALSICAVNCGKFKKACQLIQRILEEARFPERDRQRLENNQRIFKQRYREYLSKIKNQDLKKLKRQPRWELKSTPKTPANSTPSPSTSSQSSTSTPSPSTTQSSTSSPSQTSVKSSSVPNNNAESILEQLKNLPKPNAVGTTEAVEEKSGVKMRSLTIRKQPIWITLTSIPSRMGRLTKTLESLKAQTVKATRINLCLPMRSLKEDCEYQIPASVAGDPAITIVRCSKDWGPATKLIGSLEICQDPEVRLVVVDDDIIYPPDLVEKLINRSKQHPDSAIGFCGWQARDVRQGRDHFYRHLVYEDRLPNLPYISPVDVLEGYRGVLSKRRFWDLESVLDYSLAPKQAFYVDDVWLSGHLARQSVPRLAFKYEENSTLTQEQAYGQVWVANHLGGKDQNNSLSTRPDFVEANQVTADYFWDEENKLRRNATEIQHYMTSKLQAKLGQALKSFSEANSLSEVQIRNRLRETYQSVIIIPVYKRPEYLQWTLKTLVSSQLPEDCLIIFVDDASGAGASGADSEGADSEVGSARKLLDQMTGASVISVYKQSNQGVFHSLRLGIKLAQVFGVKRYCILDSDTMVRPEWFTRLTEFYDAQASCLVSGFNMGNRQHHTILETVVDSNRSSTIANRRQSIGGVNMYFSAELAEKFLPLMNDLRWDYQVCLWCQQNQVPIYTLVPSVVQHVGIKGMFSSPEKQDFDFAYDFYLDVARDSPDDPGYFWLPGVDFPGFNLDQVMEAGVDSIKARANQNPEAVAWNVSGWLKSKLEKPDGWQIEDVNQSLGIFIKQSEYHKLGLGAPSTGLVSEPKVVPKVSEEPKEPKNGLVSEPKVSEEPKPNIFLLVEDYRPDDPVRLQEIQAVFEQNLKNPLIDQICLFSEFSEGHPANSKVRVIKQTERLTYRACFEWINQNLELETICLVANADIYYDQSLSKLHSVEFDNLFMTLLRYDLTSDIQTDAHQLFSRGTVPHADAQDTWIFKAPIVIPDNSDFYFGKPGCDNRIAFEMLRMGYNLINCPYDIQSYHYHLSEHRTYEKSDPVPGAFLSLLPSRLEETMINGEYQRFYHFWGLENTKYAGWTHNQILEALEGLAEVNKIPASVAVMATNKNRDDLEILLTSLRLFHPTIPIYFICDTDIANYLENWKELNLNIHILLDGYSGKDRAKTDKQFWLDFMLNKCRIMEIALEKESDVVFLDADIVLINQLPEIPMDEAEVAMTPHYIHPDFDKSNAGFYNCGYVWTNTCRFPAWWRDNAPRSKYFEQQILDESDDHFKIHRLPLNENFGWWRALYQRPSRIGDIQMTDLGLFCGKDPIHSVHTHFTGSNLTNEMRGFNATILKSLQQSSDPKLIAIYEVIKKQQHL